MHVDLIICRLAMKAKHIHQFHEPPSNGELSNWIPNMRQYVDQDHRLVGIRLSSRKVSTKDVVIPHFCVWRILTSFLNTLGH